MDSSEIEISFKLDKEELECPVCLEIPSSLPIYQCQEGHPICNACHPKVQICPICRASLDLKIRALGMEKIWHKIMQKCKHVGCNKFSVDIEEHEIKCTFAFASKCSKCKKVVFGKDVEEHETTCEFSFAKCDFCQENVPVKDFKTHQFQCATCVIL